MKLLAEGIQNLEFEFRKYENMSQGRRSRSKCQKLPITSSVIVTDIPIKPQQFPTSSFDVACYLSFAAVTLTFDP